MILIKFLEGQPVDEYVVLLNEMKIMLESHPTANLETLYVGAGHQLLYLLNNLIDCYQVLEILPFQNGNEFTVEANPGDLTREKLPRKTMASIVYPWECRHLIIAY